MSQRAVTFNVRVSNSGNLYALFRRASSLDWMNAPMRQLTDEVLSALRNYPPPRSGTYVRTYKLRKGWQFKIRRSGDSTLSADVNNNVSYAHWVMAEDYQAKQHQGYWRTAEDILSDYEDEGEAVFGRALEAIWRWG